MDINRVRYFNVFAETGSLVRASELLHISQPALSKALKVLESEISLKLLEADGRGLKLTDAGRRFRDETQPLLSQWMGLSKKIQNQQTTAPQRIASFEVFTTYFLGHLLQFTDLGDLEIHELGPGRMEEAIASGRVDYGITYLPIPKVGVEFIEVGKIEMGVFGISKYTISSFNELPFVIPLFPMEGTPSKVLGLDGWPDHFIPRKVEFRVSMMESALELCRAGSAVAYLPKFMVRLHNRQTKLEYCLKELKCSHPKLLKHRLQSVFLIRRKGMDELKIERMISKSLRALN
jgi:DNA-binding transcriptional LysR family regulator